jgi:hypothetical protein
MFALKIRLGLFLQGNYKIIFYKYKGLYFSDIYYLLDDDLKNKLISFKHENKDISKDFALDWIKEN